MKRTPLKRRTPLQSRPKALERGKGLERRTRVAPMSEKRMAESIVRALLVKGLLAAYPRCQARWVCDGARAVDVHERLKRSRGGKITDPDQAHMITVCRPCHEMTEAEPAEATRRRLLLPSWHQCPPTGPC